MGNSANQSSADPAFNRLLIAGDSHAFDVLFSLFSAKVYRFSHGYLKSKEDAEEVVQDVFMKLWDKRVLIKEDAPISNFIFTIAHNTTLNLLRKRKNGVKAIRQHVLRHEGAFENAEDAYIYTEYEEKTQVAISTLPTRRKEIFLLSRHTNLSYKEIASKLNISPKTVEVQILLALKDIRKQLVRLGITL